MFDSDYIVLLPVLALTGLAMIYLYPFLKVLIAHARKQRKAWQYQALVGRSMTKRAKDRLVAEEFYSAMLNLVNKRVITDKDKRKYLRMLEVCLELEPGVLRPSRPTPWELKNRLKHMSFSRRKREGQAKIIPADKPNGKLASILTTG